MEGARPNPEDKEKYEDMQGKQVFGKVLIKKKFLKRARALQPVLLDPLNVQTGVAASIIVNLIEGSLPSSRKGRTREKGRNQCRDRCDHERLQGIELPRTSVLLYHFLELFLSNASVVLRKGNPDHS